MTHVLPRVLSDRSQMRVRRAHRRTVDNRTTTQRGYGYAHQKARKDALSALIDGTQCWRCKCPMYAYQSLDLDHTTPISKGGMYGLTVLTHSSCNRRAGAMLLPKWQRRRGARHRVSRW